MSKKCQAYTVHGKRCSRKTTVDKYCFQHGGGDSDYVDFIMFDEAERRDIMEHYNEIVKGPKRCMDYPMEKVLKAARGMYIYPSPIPEKKGQERLCQQINESYSEGEDPIVHEDSITAWGNQAAEQYGLEIRDIVAMKPGEKMEVILLDRNVGDYLHGSKKGQKFNPTKDGFSYATYTHKDGITGILDMHEVGVVHDPFTWEANPKQSETSWFWCPIPKGIPYKDLDPETKVGWRGPAIDVRDVQYLPEHFVHYGTWWDDYLPFRTHDFLKVKRAKK